MRRFRLKEILAGTLLAAAATVTPVAADGWGDCCGWDDCCWDGEFYGTVEALYWKPSLCPAVLAERQFHEPNDSRAIFDELAVKLDYEWGIRGRIGYENDCNFIDVAYLYIRPSETEGFVLGDGNTLRFPSTGGSMGSFRNKTSLRYQNVDVRYGHFRSKECGSRSFFYGNARWVNLDFRTDSRGLDTDDPVSLGFNADRYNQHAEFDGGGLGVGAGGHYCIGCGFGVQATMGMMAIIGQSKAFQELGDSDAFGVGSFVIRENRFKSRTCVIPGFDFRFGFDYSLCWDCFSLTGEVGYEFNYYWDVLRYAASGYNPGNLNVGSNPLGLVIPPAECQNVGFGGLYLGLTFAF